MSDILGWKFAEYFRDGKWPTLFSKGWKVADTIYELLESCRKILVFKKNSMFELKLSYS